MCILQTLNIRGIFFSKKFTIKNKKRATVYLRSPKHFNIGKHKVFSYNNNQHFTYKLNIKTPLQILSGNNRFVYKLLIQFFKFNNVFRINSIRINIKTKIKF